MSDNTQESSPFNVILKRRAAKFYETRPIRRNSAANPDSQNAKRTRAPVTLV
jgi:hypothetical protein